MSTFMSDMGVAWTAIIQYVPEHCKCWKACNLCDEIILNDDDENDDDENDTAQRSIDEKKIKDDLLSIVEQCKEELIGEGLSLESKTNNAKVKEIKEKYGIILMKTGATNGQVASLLRVSTNTVPAWRVKAN